MANRFFSLIIIPDSGSDVKRSSFNLKFVLSIFYILITTFFICLFFIIGYHIKLIQEKEYKNARSTMQKLRNSIQDSKKKLNILSDKLLTIQRNDVAYRKYAYMDVLDNDMYKAGIGGHVIVDDSILKDLGVDLQDDLKQVLIDIKLFASRVNVQEESLNEIHNKIQFNQEEINCTPSILPTHSFRVTDKYGYRIHPITGLRQFHRGVDLTGNKGDYILATADGVVVSTENQGYLGKCILIKHKYGYETLYGHLNDILVKENQNVKKGEIIGTMGITGRTTGVHVHYGIKYLNKDIDPKDYY